MNQQGKGTATEVASWNGINESNQMNEPQGQKAKCAPSEDSDQTAHLHWAHFG